MKASNSLFGWSLPAGVWDALLPGEEDVEIKHPRCEKCGAFVTLTPDGEPIPEGDPEYGNEHLTSRVWWDCTNCGHRTVGYG